MSTLLKTRDPLSEIHATSKEDVSIYLINPTEGQASQRQIGIAKTFSFNINRPKTPIEVISQRNPAGFARSPEDRTFSMNQVNVWERIEDLSYFTNSNNPFAIDIVIVKSATADGTPADDLTKVIRLSGVEFENCSSSIDANGSEFTFDFTGKFRSATITGNINAEYNPYTHKKGSQVYLPL